ncbi:MAG: inorganic phosphate transporter [Lewinellaceae bacterium]|nr:inorganic phosphate transporter [Saprospiraceae bacterium]MCB9316046.1 inorganic phosphate transporter [Lewinellaceae bacterium]MCB9330026.1 inorganic phosphate transporter [Lewinellaceae bacterium]
MLLGFILDLSAFASAMLIVCLLAVCIFEAINGFHDTANAVATVIYTNALKPVVAVIWSGIWNFLGVILGGVAVAMSITKLIPLDDLMLQPLGENIAMVLAVLLAAISWNLGTWYLGIPCSSSHALIGSLLGGGFAFWTVHASAGPNWGKAMDIGLSLFISPVFGFSLAILMMYLLKSFVKNKVIFNEPKPKKSPPLWVRSILIATCTLVSFFHGSNDGQKGIGLFMIVLMAFMPLQFVFNHSVPLATLQQSARQLEYRLGQAEAGTYTAHLQTLSAHAGRVADSLAQIDKQNKTQLYSLRKDIQVLVKSLDADVKAGLLKAAYTPEVKKDIATLRTAYEFAPTWVIVIISLCLGIGTMVGWKRIVVTIGEKIGKSHLTYAQGASAEICAAATIGVSTGFGLPVSTTHVLSSGIAGTMVAKGGIKNLQKKTIKNIALAWILTLPVVFVLSAALFYLLRLLF